MDQPTQQCRPYLGGVQPLVPAVAAVVLVGGPAPVPVLVGEEDVDGVVEPCCLGLCVLVSVFWWVCVGPGMEMGSGRWPCMHACICHNTQRRNKKSPYRSSGIKGTPPWTTQASSMSASTPFRPSAVQSAMGQPCAAVEKGHPPEAKVGWIGCVTGWSKVTRQANASGKTTTKHGTHPWRCGGTSTRGPPRPP